MPTKQDIYNALKAHADKARQSGQPDAEIEQALTQYQPRLGAEAGNDVNIPSEQNVQTTQTPDINALIQKALGPRNAGQSFGNALSILGGGKGINGGENDYSKLYAQEAIKNLPQFKDKQYVVSYDQEGKPVFTEAPGDIKNVPFYASPQGQAYYPAKTAQAQAQGQQAVTETEMMNTVLPQMRQAVSGQPGNQVTPGTTIQAGPFNVPLNPKIEADQASAISSAQVFTPQVEEIAKSVRGGIFESDYGDIGRTFRQFATDTGIPLLTSSDSKLQETQGYLNSIRRYAFGEGGKNLTETEKGIVDKLLNVTGKNDNQIVSDHQKAIAIIQNKANIALGGRNTALQGQQSTQITKFNSPEEADASGLPPGTKVTVQGRPYEIG